MAAYIREMDAPSRELCCTILAAGRQPTPVCLGVLDADVDTTTVVIALSSSSRLPWSLMGLRSVLQAAIHRDLASSASTPKAIARACSDIVAMIDHSEGLPLKPVDILDSFVTAGRSCGVEVHSQLVVAEAFTQKEALGFYLRAFFGMLRRWNILEMTLLESKPSEGVAATVPHVVSRSILLQSSAPHDDFRARLSTGDAMLLGELQEKAAHLNFFLDLSTAISAESTVTRFTFVFLCPSAACVVEHSPTIPFETVDAPLTSATTNRVVGGDPAMAMQALVVEQDPVIAVTLVEYFWRRGICAIYDREFESEACSCDIVVLSSTAYGGRHRALPNADICCVALKQLCTAPASLDVTSMISDPQISDFLWLADIAQQRRHLDNLIERLATFKRASCRSVGQFKAPSQFEHFTRGATLGQGATSVVFAASEQLDPVGVGGAVILFAVKEISIFETVDIDYAYAQEQRKKALPMHRCLVEHYHVVRSPRDDYIRVFMELCPGGSLRSRLRSGAKTVPAVSCEEARRVTRDVLLGLSFLHAQGLCHGDLKSDNVLLARDARYKLCDFANGHEGAVAWRAPEMFTEEKWSHPNPAADVWALGCVMLEMIFAVPPFQTDTPWSMRSRMAAESISEAARQLVDATWLDFTKLCFTPDPSSRPSVSTLLLHPFCMTGSTMVEETLRQLLPPTSLAFKGRGLNIDEVGPAAESYANAQLLKSTVTGFTSVSAMTATDVDLFNSCGNALLRPRGL